MTPNDMTPATAAVILALSVSAVTVTIVGCQTITTKATQLAGTQPGQLFCSLVTAGGGTIVGGGTTLPSASFVYPLPEQMELGPTLDVIPCVLADGFTVNLTLIPSLTEFVGYEDSSSFNNALPTTSGAFPGGLVMVPTVLPAFRVRQVASAVNVWDGQTVVLGGLLAETVATIKDKVPFLGDLPLAGRFFRSESKTTSKKNLLIFVTPLLIDPAGNRLHSEDEMPFAKDSFPVQPPAAADQAKKQ